MDISSEQLLGQERLRILAEQNDISDILFTILTSAGYDTITAVAMLGNDLDNLENFYKNNSQLFSPKEREKLYSKCNNCPENFVLLPGHRMKLSSFIAQCQIAQVALNVNKRKLSDADILSSDGLKLDGTKKLKTKAARKSEGVVIVASDSIDDALVATQDKLRKAFQRWQAGHPAEYVRMLKENDDYEIAVSASGNEGENAILIATVSCSNCKGVVKMTVNKSGNFCISNATRHLINCNNKEKKLKKQSNSNNLNVSNMVIIKNETITEHAETNGTATHTAQVVPLLMHNYTVVPVTQADDAGSTAEFAEITCIPELPM